MDNNTKNFFTIVHTSLVAVFLLAAFVSGAVNNQATLTHSDAGYWSAISSAYNGLAETNSL